METIESTIYNPNLPQQEETVQLNDFNLYQQERSFGWVTLAYISKEEPIWMTDINLCQRKGSNWMDNDTLHQQERSKWMDSINLCQGEEGQFGG